MFEHLKNVYEILKASFYAYLRAFYFNLRQNQILFCRYTDSVEMFSVASGQWIEGPRMSSSRKDE